MFESATIRPLCLFGALTAGLLAGRVSFAEPQTTKNRNEPGASDRAEGAPESETRRQQREENTKAMAQRALGVKLRRAEEQGATGELVRVPLFHYTDEPRRIVDATLWGWTMEGRLCGICKIEKYEQGAKPGIWLYCFGSLSPDLLDVEWADGHRFSSKKPGLAYRPIAGAPPPADGRPVRLRQMKELAARFHSTIVDVNAETREEMRLLPRPLYRYEAGAANPLDGAVFGITANGTNPDAILVIEVQMSADGRLDFVFGAAGMTQQGLILKLDDRQAWSKPHVSSVGQYDTWTYFWENR